MFGEYDLLTRPLILPGASSENMGSTGISPDKAELLAVLLEALLYGFSLLMFAASIYTLWSRRCNHIVNCKMFAVACALLLCSTAHLVIHIMRVMDGLILYRDTQPGGPVGYFSDLSKWTFDAKNLVYTAQTQIGDGVILYRCYLVWQSKLIMILPVLLWFASGITGIVIGYVSATARQSGVFGGALSRWITLWWATALATNLLATLLLLLRIWHIDRKAKGMHGDHQSQLRRILHIIVDAGVIYTLTLLVALICFLLQSDGQQVVLDMVTPIISITFYMVIIRVGIANRANIATDIPLGDVSADNTLSAECRRRMQVHVTKSTESKVEGQTSPTYQISPCSRVGCMGSDWTAEEMYDTGEEQVDPSSPPSIPYFARVGEAVSYRHAPVAYRLGSAGHAAIA
ncbi:hypothetical protein EV363DRAFT_1399813 [Boletus edulis]|nr:hypothetical protein EV363DRAFT_1399813 [Boletus edulis]